MPSLTSSSVSKQLSTFWSFRISESLLLSLNQLLMPMPLSLYKLKFSGKLSTITHFERSLCSFFKSFR
jgi:hypothetical protein